MIQSIYHTAMIGWEILIVSKFRLFSPLMSTLHSKVETKMKSQEQLLWVLIRSSACGDVTLVLKGHSIQGGFVDICGYMWLQGWGVFLFFGTALYLKPLEFILKISTVSMITKKCQISRCKIFDSRKALNVYERKKSTHSASYPAIFRAESWLACIISCITSKAEEWTCGQWQTRESWHRFSSQLVSRFTLTVTRWMINGCLELWGWSKPYADHYKCRQPYWHIRKGKLPE